MKSVHIEFYLQRLRNLAGLWDRLSESPDDWLNDPEQIHVWRTTYRRLQVLTRWGPKPTRKDLKAALTDTGIRDLMRKSSELRDRQVIVQHLQAWREEAPLELDPVPERLQADIRRALPAWFEAWREIRARRPLEPLLQGESRNPKPTKDLLTNIRADFAKEYRRWHEDLRKVARFSPDHWDAERMHRLRIRAKRIRYLGEWWEPLLTGPQQTALAGLRQYHQVAGQLQDCIALISLIRGVIDGNPRPARLLRAALWVHGRAVGWEDDLRCELGVVIGRIARR